MNYNLLAIFLVPFVIAIAYFTFFEDVDTNFFKAIPSDFVEQTQNLLGEGVEPEVDETLEFLNQIEEINEQESEKNFELAPPKPEEKATYQVRFVGTWSQSTHAGYYINTAHFSPFVVWTHPESLKVFSAGKDASAGLEKVAELGGTVTFEKELDLLKDRGLKSYSIGKRFDAPGESLARIEVSEKSPFVTAVSMIAPSPDWIVAAEDVLLYEDDTWATSTKVFVRTYDAGTEQGSSFSITNPATDPHEPVKPLTDIPAGSLESFGYFEFTQVQ